MEQRKLLRVLKGETPLKDRPGKHLKPVDLEAARAEASEKAGGVEIDDEDLAGYLMYPKVFTDYRARHETYGPVRTLPTRTFFYGMEPGEEISAEIAPGKTLAIRLQAVGEAENRADDRAGDEAQRHGSGQPGRIGIAQPMGGFQRRNRRRRGEPERQGQHLRHRDGRDSVCLAVVHDPIAHSFVRDASQRGLEGLPMS